MKDPHNADARLLLGSLLMEAGNGPASIAQLQEAVKLRPNSEEAQNALGEACNKFGQLDTAKAAFQKAVALKPNDGVAQLNLGRVLEEQNHLDEAAQHLDRAIALLGKTDDGADARYVRAKISSAHAQPSDAAKLLEQAVAIRPRFPQAWSDLGQARTLLQDDAGALSAFERAAELDPKDGVAQYRLGAEYLRLDKIAPAVEHLQIACDLNPSDQSSLNALQRALRQKGDYEGANRIKQRLADLLKQRDVTNQNKLAAVRINNEGATLEKAGDISGALAKYREAAQLDPDHNGIAINYGVALLRTGQWTEGLNTLHSALQRDPGNKQLRAAILDALHQAPRWAIPKWANDGTW